ncbi:MAG TPA: helix-turn-helix domain-containing protein [Candidatus Acidoferrales bacterium]|jgi:hypothetical protein|nr:helix-turn-helix domain-containing protein [Candidatus Acidoferrales bacterium]
MDRALSVQKWPPAGDTDKESPREALGRFLRQRREALAPEQVGILSRRGRRTPGLRREEVAFLADIGVKWYARLEAAEDIHPSAATLSSVAVALRLTDAEFDYVFELAGLQQPVRSGPEVTMLPEPLSIVVGTMRGVAATVCDRVLTPLRWNALSDALYGHSKIGDSIERNALFRSLLDPNFIIFLGSEHQALVTRGVGMLRLNLSSPHPSPFAAGVYERIKEHPMFRAAWNGRIIASDLTDQHAVLCHVTDQGSLAMYATDFVTAAFSNLTLRVLSPADAQTTAAFARLERNAPP